MIAKKKKARRKTKEVARKGTKKPDLAAFYSALVEKSDRACLASQVEGFKAVPTIFPGFNRASTVGGAPLSCVWLVHGPSMGGKSVYTCGLIRSFQMVGGLAMFVDAELSADTVRWMPRLGVDMSRLGYIGRTSGRSKRPMTYEETVDEVERVLNLYQTQKREGLIPPAPLIIVVDSVSKMVPNELMKKITGKEGGTALRGGVGRIQALLNTAWLAALGPRIGDDDILLAIIAHEMEDEGGNAYKRGWKVRGGGALVYDSMMQVRVSYAGQVRDYADEGSPPTGKRHKVIIYKNKHGPAFGTSAIYTSNGRGLCPMGFDRPREIVHEGLVRGVVSGPKDHDKLSMGTRIEFEGKRWTLKQLYEPDGLEAIEALAERLDAEEPDE